MAEAVSLRTDKLDPDERAEKPILITRFNKHSESGSTQPITTFAQVRNVALQSEIAGTAASRSRPIEESSINTSITRNPSLLDPTDVPNGIDAECLLIRQ